jgi:Na+/proline symporter
VQVLSSTFWAAAQALAFGHIIAAVSGLELRDAILAGVAVVVIYTMMGGLLADVLTDAIQGAVLVIGLIVTLVALVLHLGGWSAAFGAIRIEQLHLLTDAEPLATQLDEWTIAILGSLTAQEAISRILATRSAETARRATFAAAGIYFVIGLIPVIIGLLGATAMPPGDSPSDSWLPDLARTMLPTPVFVIFIGALISAILSTVDSTVLSVSALLTRNIIEPLRPDLSEHAKLWLQRAMTAATGVAVYIIATAGDNIYALIQTTSSFGSAGILVVMLAGLWLNWGGPWTGFATVAAGIGLTFLTQQVLELEAAYICSIAGCVLVYVTAGLVESRPRATTDA